jgi:hypothetical protein
MALADAILQYHTIVHHCGPNSGAVIETVYGAVLLYGRYSPWRPDRSAVATDDQQRAVSSHVSR